MPGNWKKIGNMKGTKGEPGNDGTSPPAPTLRVGEVTTLPATATATAEITGEAPDYTLTLGIPQGAKGDSTATPVVVPALSLLTGAGRPDTRATLSPENREAVAAAPVGASFTSTDGAGTGAWAWVKTPTGWQVTYGETRFSVFHAQGTTGNNVGPLSKGWVARVGREVTAVVMLDKDSGSVWSVLTPVPPGFRPYQTQLRLEQAAAGADVKNPTFASVDYVIINGNGDRAELPDGNSIHVTQGGVIRGKSLPSSGWASLSWATADPWPAFLPGSPA